jgi:titin
MANATTLVAPAAPSGLVATSLTASQIRLTWSDNSGNETGFQIERVVGTNFATGSGRTAWNVGANATSYNEPAGALATGVTYTYRVRAFNAAGTSAFSNEATSTTLATPATPTGLTATVSGTVITLQWNDTSLNEAGFRIERKVNSGAYIQIRELDANNTSTVTYADTNLTVGNSYTYRVRAYNSVGNSGFSNEATGTITSGSALPAPSNLTATALSGLRAQITWTDNSTTETGFRIERQLGSGAFVEIAVVAANQTAYVDSRLQAGSVYTYRVRAYSGFKTTTYTNVASITAIR